jgi:hypothetical protein
MKNSSQNTKPFSLVALMSVVTSLAVLVTVVFTLATQRALRKNPEDKKFLSEVRAEAAARVNEFKAGEFIVSVSGKAYEIVGGFDEPKAFWDGTNLHTKLPERAAKVYGPRDMAYYELAKKFDKTRQ